LKKTSDSNVSKQVSRGEKIENIKADFRNENRNETENSTSDTTLEPTYSAENSGLDSILNEATTTKAEIHQAETAVKKQEKQMMSDEEAAGFAVMGLQQFSDAVTSFSGRKLKFGKEFVGIFAMATVPIIKKYSRYITLDPSKIDLDSWMPEILALGSVTAIGGSTWFQLRQPEEEPVENEQGADNGDKS
jgi:hypothetical protein